MGSKEISPRTFLDKISPALGLIGSGAIMLVAARSENPSKVIDCAGGLQQVTVQRTFKPGEQVRIEGKIIYFPAAGDMRTNQSIYKPNQPLVINGNDTNTTLLQRAVGGKTDVTAIVVCK